jgi:hypothetical protein
MIKTFINEYIILWEEKANKKTSVNDFLRRTSKENDEKNTACSETQTKSARGVKKKERDWKLCCYVEGGV